jgi:hypothetical protein
MPIQLMSNEDLIKEYELLNNLIYELQSYNYSHMLRIQAIANEIEYRGLEIYNHY